MLLRRMLANLSDREVRTLRIGLIILTIFFVVGVLPRWWSHWSSVRAELRQMQELIEQAAAGRFNPAGLATMVPVFEMPKDLETQKSAFRDMVSMQLRRAGMPNAPLQVEQATRQKVGGFIRLSLKYKATCRFEQLLEFLVLLKQNPYYAGLEDLTIKADTKKTPEERQTVDVEMTISTLVKGG